MNFTGWPDDDLNLDSSQGQRNRSHFWRHLIHTLRIFMMVLEAISISLLYKGRRLQGDSVSIFNLFSSPEDSLLQLTRFGILHGKIKPNQDNRIS